MIYKDVIDIFQLNLLFKMDDSSASPDIVNITLTLTGMSGAAFDASINIDLAEDMQAYWGPGIPAGAIYEGRKSVFYNTTISK